MKRQGEQHISSLLTAILSNNPEMEQEYLKYKIKSSIWPDIVGDFVSKSTQDITFDGDKMIVKINSSIIRNEILLIRKQLVYKINKSAGSWFINEIIIR